MIDNERKYSVTIMPATRENLRDLQRVLGQLDELEWFHTLGKNVTYPSQISVHMVKEKVDHVIGGLSILYLFAIFETYFDQGDWDGLIDPNELRLLRAYRHVRHSVAHGHHGLRIHPRTNRNQEEYDRFDEAIRDQLFFPKNIIELDATDNKIKIDPSVGIYLRRFMRDIIQNTIVKVYS